jgi:hypothetical protein
MDSTSFTLMLRFVNFMRREFIAIVSFTFILIFLIPTFILGARNIRSKYLYDFFSCETSPNLLFLPSSIKSHHYNMTIIPDYSKSIFYGNIKIEIEVFLFFDLF